MIQFLLKWFHQARLFLSSPSRYIHQRTVKIMFELNICFSIIIVLIKFCRMLLLVTPPVRTWTWLWHKYMHLQFLLYYSWNWLIPIMLLSATLSSTFACDLIIFVWIGTCFRCWKFHSCYLQRFQQWIVKHVSEHEWNCTLKTIENVLKRFKTF